MWPAKLLKDYTVGTKSVEHRERVHARKKKNKERKKRKKTFPECNLITCGENVFGLCGPQPKAI